MNYRSYHRAESPLVRLSVRAPWLPIGAALVALLLFVLAVLGAPSSAVGFGVGALVATLIAIAASVGWWGERQRVRRALIELNRDAGRDDGASDERVSVDREAVLRWTFAIVFALGYFAIIAADIHSPSRCASCATPAR